ncbi:MAG: hypothetical protein JRC87_07740 [Deltaproteobacteria bacterium]|nr:hypothetical protein [Deltaproteobacteria bacterium]MBW2659465.1 hypothetical protein [Deltaproteobacteria bacterium]
MGRIRLRHLENISSDSLLPFIQGVVEPGGFIHTDDWSGYTDLSYTVVF